MKQLLDFGKIMSDVFKFFDDAYREGYLHYLIAGLILIFILIMMN